MGSTNEQQALYADRQRSNEMLGWQLKLDKLRVKFICVFVNEGSSTMKWLKVMSDSAVLEVLTLGWLDCSAQMRMNFKVQGLCHMEGHNRCSAVLTSSRYHKLVYMWVRQSLAYFVQQDCCAKQSRKGLIVWICLFISESTQVCFSLPSPIWLCTFTSALSGSNVGFSSKWKTSCIMLC